MNDAPTIRLATNPGTEKQRASQGATWLQGLRAGEDQRRNLEAPALLVSYVYLEGFEKHRSKYWFRDWVLDSGAFSAHNSGTEIKLQDYIDTAKRLLESDGQLSEVFALDVIGDAKASLRNCEEMWRQGIAAIPCFHRGSDVADLKHIAKDYPKIALGGVAMLRGDAKMDWSRKCFDHVWPCKVHGFGFGTEKQVLALPWHSVDATNWEIGPCAFGQWKKFGKMSVRGSNQNLRSQVEHYLEIERKARTRWKKEMAQLDTCGPVVRLAEQADSRPQVKQAAFASPEIRLAVTNAMTSSAESSAKFGYPFHKDHKAKT